MFFVVVVVVVHRYPTLANAYNADLTGKQGQYFYGNDMIVSPVTSPSAPGSSFLANKTWWVPPGTWVEEHSHHVYTGNADGTTMVREQEYFQLDNDTLILWHWHCGTVAL